MVVLSAVLSALPLPPAAARRCDATATSAESRVRMHRSSPGEGPQTRRAFTPPAHSECVKTRLIAPHKAGQSASATTPCMRRTLRRGLWMANKHKPMAAAPYEASRGWRRGTAACRSSNVQRRSGVHMAHVKGTYATSGMSAQKGLLRKGEVGNPSGATMIWLGATAVVARCS